MGVRLVKPNFQTERRLITQDCLLLAGEKDHYIPYPGQYELTRNSLVNAHSVRGRVFTENEAESSMDK
jgi:hypothetical protein